MSIISEPSWVTVVEKLHHPGTTALLLGASDSGKTTLSWYLIEALLRAGKGVCLLDADIGQSTIGPPATVSIKLYKTIEDIDSNHPDLMSFVGVFNPSKRLNRILHCIDILYNKAKSLSPHCIIVDTTGLISGDMGLYLKKRKIDIIKPNYVIALQREGELEHILKDIKDPVLIRLPVSPHVRIRSRQYRINYRNKQFERYFQDLYLHGLELTGISLEYKDKIFRPSEIYIEENTVLGLNRKDDITLALGIFERIEGGKIFFSTPLQEVKGIERIVVGEIEYG